MRLLEQIDAYIVQRARAGTRPSDIATKKNVRRFLRKALRKGGEKESTAARMDAPTLRPDRPTQGAGTQAPPVDTPSAGNVGASAGRSHSTVAVPTESPASVPAESNSPETASEVAADRARKPSLDGAEPVRQVDGDRAGEAARAPASPAADHAAFAEIGETISETLAGTVSDRDAGKSGGPSGSSAPTLIDRIRALHAVHPEYTCRQAAESLGEPYQRVHNNSAAYQVRWTRVPRADYARSTTPTIKDLIRPVYGEHPDWTARQIAEAIDRPFTSVRRGAPRQAVEARPVARAPTPAPIPERPPVTPRAPVAAIPSGSGSAVITKPMVRAPRGTRFWLRNEAGEYLNRYCSGMTKDRRDAWSGSQEQLAACRRNFIAARDLIERVVEKEQSRVEA